MTGSERETPWPGLGKSCISHREISEKLTPIHLDLRRNRSSALTIFQPRDGTKGTIVVGQNNRWAMTQISILYVDEAVQFDQKQIRHLFKLLGTKDAQDVLATAMRELSARLTRAESFFQAGNWDEFAICVAGLDAIGEQIGMRSLSTASRAVSETLDVQDTAATAATFFRLMRIGDKSLTDYQLLCDTSG